MCLCLMLTAGMAYVQPLLIQDLIDNGFIKRHLLHIYILISLLFFSEGVKQGFEIIKVKYMIHVYNGLFVDLNTKVLQKTAVLPMQYFARKNGAEIVSTVNTDIQAVTSLIHIITVPLISSILQMFGGMIGLIALRNELLIPIVAIIGIKACIIKKFLKKEVIYLKN